MPTEREIHRLEDVSGEFGGRVASEPESRGTGAGQLSSSAFLRYGIRDVQSTAGCGCIRKVVPRESHALHTVFCVEGVFERQSCRAGTPCT